MTEEQKIVFIQSQILCATAEIQGMVAENSDRLARDGNVSYTAECFMDVPSRYGLEHNQVIEYLKGV